MCGAFSIIYPFKELGRRFNAGYNEEDDHPRYNARPTQNLPVVIEQDNENRLVLAGWGLTPSWMKGKVLFNTRNESLANKPFFERLFGHSRCLVPADGFYEWQALAGKKQPFRFTLKNQEIFGFAGICETDKTSGQLQFSIITTEPNQLVEKIHNRMPVIIQRQYEEAYLDGNTDPQKLLNFLKPYPAGQMEAYPVSTLVNSAKNDSIDIIKPVKM